MSRSRELTIDELLKLKAAVLYIVDKCKEIDYFHIFKILYFADGQHYAKYGRRIVKDTFCALGNGPVPSNLYNAIKTVVGKGSYPELSIISDALKPADDVYYYMITGTEKPDMDELSKSDIECLEKSIVENKDIPFGDLSKKSHDAAWTEAWNIKDATPMDDLSIAKAAGADSAMIEYIKENELVDSLIE